MFLRMTTVGISKVLFIPDVKERRCVVAPSFRALPVCLRCSASLVCDGGEVPCPHTVPFSSVVPPWNLLVGGDTYLWKLL